MIGDGSGPAAVLWDGTMLDAGYWMLDKDKPTAQRESASLIGLVSNFLSSIEYPGSCAAFIGFYPASRIPHPVS